MADEPNAAVAFEADTGMSESLTIADSSPPEATKVHHYCRAFGTSPSHSPQSFFPSYFCKSSRLNHIFTSIKLVSGEVFTAYTDPLTYWSPKTRVLLEGGTNG
ncbi:hypothetical protein MPH_01143 [Macrophomina phaseolina MS6]|uniref:Uncharacterized protein n=1 Tax=Macrophomina phaseolina (strain MS6) TaxID=1126212 RepID=K2SGL7_MACPH|nr:hypothetical protein MPH_01143 [Macrophomina phaseolina MS6]